MQRIRGRQWLAAIAALVVAQTAFAQFVAGRYEQVESVRSADILPASLYRSPYYRIAEEADVRGNAYVFNVETDTGFYEIASRALLELRAYETSVLAQAVAQFEKRDRKLATELRGQLEVRGNRIEDILTSPFSTATNLAGQLGRNVADTLGEPRRRPGEKRPALPRHSGDPAAAAHRRTAASQLRLDVYSANPAVQRFLDAVASARQSGNVAAGSALITVPTTPRVSVAGGKLDEQAEVLVRRLDRIQLDAAVAGELGALGVRPAEADAFMANPFLTPRYRLAIAAHLDHMGNVPGRQHLVKLASTARSEADVLAYRDMAIMLAHLAESESAIRGIGNEPGLPVATLADGRLAVALAVDILYWDSGIAGLADWLARAGRERGARGTVLLLGGSATPRAASSIAGKGIDIREHYLRLK